MLASCVSDETMAGVLICVFVLLTCSLQLSGPPAWVCHFLGLSTNSRCILRNKNKCPKPEQSKPISEPGFLPSCLTSSSKVTRFSCWGMLTLTETFPKVPVVMRGDWGGGITETGGSAGFAFWSSVFLGRISGGWGTTLTTQLNILAARNKLELHNTTLVKKKKKILFVRIKLFLFFFFLKYPTRLFTSSGCKKNSNK